MFLADDWFWVHKLSDSSIAFPPFLRSELAKNTVKAMLKNSFTKYLL